MAAESGTEDRDETQRTLERKALRNVRNLVDKLEDEERAHRRLTVRFVVASLVVAFAVAGIVFVGIVGTKTRQAPVVSPR